MDEITIDEPSAPRILIVGPGAVGQYLAARLLDAGRDVTLLARPAAAARLRERGVVLRDLTAGTEQTFAPAVLAPDELAADADADATAPASAPFDVVLVTVKAPGLPWAADAIATPGVIGSRSAVIPLLNGLAQLDVLGAAAGSALLGATVRIIASLDADGAVVLHRPLHRITVGELAGGTRDRVARAAQVLDVPGVDVVVTDDVTAELWNKWYFIVASGVVGVLARGTVGQIVAQPGGTEFVDAVLAETASVAAAAGHVVPDADLAASRGLLTEAGSTFVSSLYRDVVAGRAGESEHIVGDFVRRAGESGVATPLCDVALLQMRVVTAS